MHRAIRIAFFFALVYCILYAAINNRKSYQCRLLKELLKESAPAPVELSSMVFDQV
jgi:nicotinamide riboside transporter PnuC